MMRFEYIFEDDNRFGDRQPDMKLVLETDAVIVDHIIEAFEQFLHGCGYAPSVKIARVDSDLESDS